MIFLPFAFLAPLCSFVLLMMSRHKLQPKQVSTLSIIAMLLSVGASVASCYSYMSEYGLGSLLNINMGGWLYIGDYTPSISLAVDGLTIMMVLIISFIGLLTHVFCAWYLPNHLHTYQEEKERTARYSTYISYLNLLLVAMLIFVLADNLLLLYLACEAVTLASFLLVNFDSPHVGKRLKRYASRPSFMANRIANTCLAVGFFLLFYEFGIGTIWQINDTAPLYEASQNYTSHYADNQSNLVLAMSAIVLGALGLSAQLPLHSWVLNTNASKAPSSLIMVGTLVLTLGVYLLARLQPLLTLTPDILFWWVGVLGAVSMIVGAVSALAQTDIKRLLAFASISQVGFMFIGMGVGAWQSAVFHLLSFAWVMIGR